MLEALLDGEFEVLNLGRGGRTMIDVGNDFYQRTNAWDQALASGASVVLICLGTNDAKEEFWVDQLSDPAASFLSAYADMIQQLRQALGDPLIVPIVPIPQVRGGSDWPDPSIINEALPPLVAQAAAANGLNFSISVRPPLVDDNGDAIYSLYDDIIHANDDGYFLVAVTIAEVLAPILNVSLIFPPTYVPTAAPSYGPTPLPTPVPTPLPVAPSPAPNYSPTASPSAAPAYTPTTGVPSPAPHAVPTLPSPTIAPVDAPTRVLQRAVNPDPMMQMYAPTYTPTAAPQPDPTASPAYSPTLYAPTAAA